SGRGRRAATRRRGHSPIPPRPWRAPGRDRRRIRRPPRGSGPGCGSGPRTEREAGCRPPAGTWERGRPDGRNRPSRGRRTRRPGPRTTAPLGPGGSLSRLDSFTTLRSNALSTHTQAFPQKELAGVAPRPAGAVARCDLPILAYEGRRWGVPTTIPGCALSHGRVDLIY